MLTQEKFDKWKQAVEKKIAISAEAPTQTVVEDKPLKMILSREDNNVKAYIEYKSELQDKTDDKLFTVMTLQWHRNYLLVEQSLVKRVDGQEEETSYGATLYTKFTGVRVRDVNGDRGVITLLYQKEEENLPIILSSKDARKLVELICKLEQG